jgi:hypothetical protein
MKSSEVAKTESENFEHSLKKVGKYIQTSKGS